MKKGCLRNQLSFRGKLATIVDNTLGPSTSTFKNPRLLGSPFIWRVTFGASLLVNRVAVAGLVASDYHHGRC